MADEFGIPLVANSSSTLAPLPQPAPVTEEMRRVAEEFESVFLAEMMAPMFDGLETDGLGGGGAGEAMFRPMLIERYAESISNSGGVGIADSIIRELQRMQAQSPEDVDGADR